MTDDFDWYAEGADVVVREQPALAVYCNSGGQAVIRRQRDCYEEEDATVVVSRELVPVLARALFEATGFGAVEFVLRQGDGQYVDLDEGATGTAPTKEAARQRRYRTRKRNGGDASVTLEGDADVTPHNGAVTTPLLVEATKC